jgi:mono/diheme cytochrome c family protein
MKTLNISACIVGGLSLLSYGNDADLGKQTYMTVCVACHQPTGAGLPPVFPPIVKTEYVEGSAARLIAIVLKGILGPITVSGSVFNNVMPPQEAMLTDEKIASVLTYVRSSFGNSAPAVSVSEVSEVRRKFADRKLPWSEADLKSWAKE